MKTRDRILVTSLELFNIEGEAHTTTIDIANELDISPGNLYYHFKGKDDIIAELFLQFETALTHTLRAPIERPLAESEDDIQDNWYYLYVVLEDMYQYRFFYLNLEDISQRYSDIQRRFKRLIQLKKNALQAICEALSYQSVLNTDSKQLQGLVENLSLTLTYWLPWHRLNYATNNLETTIHQGVLQLMTMIAPYLGEEQLDFYNDCQRMYQQALKNAS